MATTTRAVSINAAFLQEIKEDNRDLHQITADATDSLDRPVEIIPLVKLLGQLRDQLALHFSLEEAYGYFEDAVDAAPHLSAKADELRGEHKTLFEHICKLVEEGERRLYRETPAKHEDVAEQLGQFLAQLREHENRENELIIQALEDDIGVGD